MKWLLLLVAALSLPLTTASARSFTVAAYNVENFFDGDGVSVYEDYASNKYKPTDLANKARNAARLLKAMNNGQGPDIAVLNEIEIDQTPSDDPTQTAKLLEKYRTTSIEKLTSQGDTLEPDLADAPAEFWLLKACAEAGLTDYNIALPDDKPGLHEGGRPRSVKNVILSRFSITSSKTIPLTDARSILEATIDIDGHPLVVFANHWKSGAGSQENEQIRLSNAATLRKRLDEIFAKNPKADVVVAGDLNSQYNQAQRYPTFPKTGVDGVLKAQGDEAALQKGGADLYNLWYELPVDKRGSDIYQDEWGTLIHLILSRGLYDKSGIQYRDNSFTVAAFPGMNTDAIGRPRRWPNHGRKGIGYSDHFPVLAEFQTVDANQEGWMPLKNPSLPDSPETPAVRKFSAEEFFKNAIPTSSLKAGADLKSPDLQRKFYRIDAPASYDDVQNRILVDVAGASVPVFTRNTDLRKALIEKIGTQKHLTFFAALGSYRGEPQFEIPFTDWVEPSLEKPSKKSSPIPPQD